MQYVSLDGDVRPTALTVLALAGPLALASAIQAVLGLVDTWFVGRISTEATAALGVNFYASIATILFLFGGIGTAVQAQVAEHTGANRHNDVGPTVGAGLAVSALTLPLFVSAMIIGTQVFPMFGLDQPVEAGAIQYWRPRMLGGPLVLATWVATGLFNGIERTRLTLANGAVIALANVGLNQLFIIELDWGVSGAAWATNLSLAVGLAHAAFVATRPDFARYGSMLTCTPWLLRPLAASGFAIGLFMAVDLVGFACFQFMVSRLGSIEGAASQIVMMFTSLGFYPMIGIGLAGTTLVANQIGAGNAEGARSIGDTAVRVGIAYMAVFAALLALVGPLLIPLFVSGSTEPAAEVIATARTLILIAAGYQVLDALNLGYGFILRGTNDLRIPAVGVAALSLLGFIPLTHSLTFGDDAAGFIGWLPQAGLGVEGAWLATVIYTTALAVFLRHRWRSGPWQRMARPHSPTDTDTDIGALATNGAGQRSLNNRSLNNQGAPQ